MGRARGDVGRPLAGTYESWDAAPTSDGGGGLCADTRDHNFIAEDGAPTSPPARSIDQGNQSSPEPNRVRHAGPGECVKCFRPTGVSDAWCDGCLNDLRGAA